MYHRRAQRLESWQVIQKERRYPVKYVQSYIIPKSSQKIFKIQKVLLSNSSRDPDMIENTTRFFVLSARSSPSSNTSRTFLRFTVDHTKAGALCDVLQAFKRHDLNLTSIVSRPAVNVDRLWTYVFFVEFEGHEEDQSVQKVVAEIRINSTELRVLGSYETHSDV